MIILILVEFKKKLHYVKGNIILLEQCFQIIVQKGKHFRYKKRYSFLTEDRIFRVDLTVVKETKRTNGKFKFSKTFKEADILKNKENYELEIEYVGWKNDVGVSNIDLSIEIFKKILKMLILYQK